MRIIFVSFFILFGSACSTNHEDRIKYYDFDVTKLANSEATQGNSNTFIHLNSVKIHGVSDQQAITQILSDNTIHIANYHFWAQHPKYSLTSHLQNNLTKSMNQFTFIPEGKKRLENGDLVIDILLTKLTGHHEYGSVISGQWFIYKQSSGSLTLIDTRIFSQNTSLQDSGFESLISAHQIGWNNIIDKLSVRLNTL